VADLVSILIPAYNAGRWIGRTIESALAQTWENKEIIVVDDGSRDDTLEIAKSFGSASVSVVTQPNKGAGAARNHAFGLSKGDFIQWLDADDLLAPDKIALQMKAAGSREKDLTLYSSVYGVFYHRLEKTKFVPTSLWQDLSPADWLTHSFAECLWMNPAVWLVSRELAEKAGPWDERLSLDDDGEYFARVVAASNRVVFVHDAICNYRQSGFGQLSRAMSEPARRSLFLSSTLRIQHLLSLEDTERTRKACLALLRSILPVLHPESPELVLMAGEEASKLGGSLIPPTPSRRAALLQKLLGPRRAKEVRTLFRKLRMAAAVKWDEVMNKLRI
jgi:GT2 family glycosyltransferase